MLPSLRSRAIYITVGSERKKWHCGNVFEEETAAIYLESLAKKSLNCTQLINLIATLHALIIKGGINCQCVKLRSRATCPTKGKGLDKN